MYYLNSIQLHNDKDFMVNYSLLGYDHPYSMNVTIDGDQFEQWYYELDEVAWESFDDMVNDTTGIFMYMRKYFEYLYEQRKNEEGYGIDINDGDWSMCPYDELRDLEQDQV